MFFMSFDFEACPFRTRVLRKHLNGNSGVFSDRDFGALIWKS